MTRPQRPENADRVSMNLRLPRHLYDRLHEESAERDQSVNYMITRAVERYLDNLVPLP